MRQIFFPVTFVPRPANCFSIIPARVNPRTVSFGALSFLFLLAIFILAPGPARARARDAGPGASPPAMELTAVNGNRILFGPASHFLPSLAIFRIGSTDSSVRLGGVGLSSLAEVTEANYQLREEGPPKALETVLTLKTGQQATLRTSLADDAPALRFDLDAGPGADSGLVLSITGADRLIYPANGQFTMSALPGFQAPSPVSCASLVLQNADTQEGLSFSCGSSGAGMQIVGVDGGSAFLAVHGSGGHAEVIVRAFRGDSILALEKAGHWTETAMARADADRSSPAACQAGEACPTGEACPVEERISGSYWSFWSDKGRVFKILRADPREAIFRFGHLVDQDGNTYEDMNFGGDLGLVYAEFPHGGKFSLTCRGLFTARFDLVSESFDLLNTDFIGGAAAGYQWGAHSLELFVYHQSSHLGDEILDRDERERIDYGRETIRFLYSYEWDRLRLYAGPSYHINALPEDLDRKLGFQAGAEYWFYIKNRPLFLAGDFQSRQEHDWSVNATGQIGFELGNPEKTGNRQWIFGEAFAGYSNMGQFWDRWERYLMIGVGYKFH